MCIFHTIYDLRTYTHSYAQTCGGYNDDYDVSVRKQISG